jgi:hypothetical protein
LRNDKVPFSRRVGRLYACFMKSQQTLTIEKMLVAGGNTFTHIANKFGISLSRVQLINKRRTKLSRAQVRELYNVDKVLKSTLMERTAQTGWII